MGAADGAQAGDTEVILAAPGAGLRAHVRSYCGFRERTTAPVRRRELPFGGVAVILALDDEWWLGEEVAGDRPLTRHTSFVGGLIDGPVVSEHRGRAFTLQFDLTPLGARALFGVPGRELSGRVLAFDELLGRHAPLLVEQLACAPTWPARFALLDAFLLRRITAGPAPSPDVEWAWRRLTASHGQVPIADLVDELGCSPRHLAARFGEDVGMTPKAFGRLLRFERAVARLQRPGDELGRIAADCGFSDQAHFTRELRAFAGVPPTALLAERSQAGFIL
ncbi:MAG: Helix-turn-helix, AraC domain protein [Solirubrobacterales bacterium]|nr:Helix-turn-helix, AraC domain protein [Solirubrobacterales bacterium]